MVGIGIILSPSLSSYREAKKWGRHDGPTDTRVCENSDKEGYRAGTERLPSHTIPGIPIPTPRLLTNLMGTILEDLTTQSRVEWALETGLMK